MNITGQIYYSGQMFVFDENGNKVETLINADFTKTLYIDGVLIGSVGVTVSHLTRGGYQAHFTPDRAGSWTLFIAQATYNPAGWTERVEVDPARVAPTPVPDDGDYDALLAAQEPSDFQAYFTRDFKYLPEYVSTKTYFLDDVVCVSAFYKCLADSVQGVLPGSDPTKWEAVNISASVYVLDSDIDKAFDQALQNVNADIFDTSRSVVDAYFYCSAHFLVMDIRMAESGLDNRSEGLVSSKSVGGVSVSYQLPEAFRTDPNFAFFAQTAYGLKYLSYVIPRVTGRPGIAAGATLY